MFIELSLISSNETNIRPSEAIIMPNKFVINYEAIFNLLQQMRYYIQNYSEFMELSKPFRNEHFFSHQNGHFLSNPAFSLSNSIRYFCMYLTFKLLFERI